MPTTSVTSSGFGSERVVNYPPRDRTRTSSGESSFTSSASSGSYLDIDRDDGIEPEDSASRSRRPHSHTLPHRYAAPVAPPPPPVAPPGSRHRATHRADEIPSRHHSLHHHRERERERETHSLPHSQSSSRHRRVDSRRVPSDESAASTVASHDDYPYGRSGAPPPPRAFPGPGFRPPQPGPPGHPPYHPSLVGSQSGYLDPFAAAQQQALVHMPQQDPFGYPPSGGNPFATQNGPANPFSPIPSSSASGYFGAEHAASMGHHGSTSGGAPPRNHALVGAGSIYGSEMMAPYGGNPYGGYGYPHMPMGWPYPPPSQRNSPPPNEEVERLKAQIAKQEKDLENKKREDLEAMKELIQKHEEARLAREKEWTARLEAEAAAKAAALAKEEEEKRRKEEIAAASKKAKDDAEAKAAEDAKKAKEEAEAAAKKLQEEADKKIKEIETAKAEADKKLKEAEAEAARLKPPDEMGLAPIRFRDAVGRSFVFPFHLCRTWKLMETLIKQAFMHVAVVGEHVHAGHYDLTGPDGEIILPQVWETMIKPDWEVSMHLWPVPEPPKEEPPPPPPPQDMLTDPFANYGGLGNLSDLDYALLGMDHGHKKGGGKKEGKKGKKIPAGPKIVSAPGPPPPPPGPGGLLSDPLFDLGMLGHDPVLTGKPSSSGSRSKAKARPQVGGFAGWLAGGGVSRSKKDKEKRGRGSGANKAPVVVTV